MDKTFQASDIEACAASIIEAAGSNPKEARTVARNLVLANLTGHDSHGVGMVPRYVDAVLEGGLKPNAHIKVNLDAGALLALDAQRGYGQVAGEPERAARALRERDGIAIDEQTRKEILGAARKVNAPIDSAWA